MEDYKLDWLRRAGYFQKPDSGQWFQGTDDSPRRVNSIEDLLAHSFGSGHYGTRGPVIGEDDRYVERDGKRYMRGLAQGNPDDTPGGPDMALVNRFRGQSIYDPTEGWLIPEEYAHAQIEAEAKRSPDGFFSPGGPFDAFGKTVGLGLGLAGGLGALTNLGIAGQLGGFSDFFAALAPEGGYQSLFSSLGQHAVQNGGGLSDFGNLFGGGDSPWPVNSPRQPASFVDGVLGGDFGDLTSTMGHEELFGGGGGLAGLGGTHEAINGMIPGMGTKAGAVAGGGGFMGALKGLFGGGGGEGIGGSGIGLGDVLKAGGNFLLNQYMADQYGDIAGQAADRADTLNHPKRAPFQQQLYGLLSNPESFFETNPVVKAQLDLARQQFNANTGKMGTGGTQFNDYLKNVQNIAANTFNDQANLLGGLGGFNQGAGYAGNVFANLADRGVQQQMESFRGLGQQIFGKLGGQDQMKQNESPTGTKVVSLF